MCIIYFLQQHYEIDIIIVPRSNDSGKEKLMAFPKSHYQEVAEQKFVHRQSDVI